LALGIHSIREGESRSPIERNGRELGRRGGRLGDAQRLIPAHHSTLEHITAHGGTLSYTQTREEKT